MAPSRGKGKAVSGASASTLASTSPSTPPSASASRSVRTGRKPARSRANGPDAIPDVFQSLLDEAAEQQSGDSPRPLKRQKVATPVNKWRPSQPRSPANNRVSTTPATTSFAEQPSSAAAPSRSRAQIVEESSEDSSEDEVSEFEFEDVDIDLTAPAVAELSDDGLEDLAISIQPESTTKVGGSPRRKPPTFAEKTHRLMVHKLHVLCLLGHCMYLNGRCNNPMVHKHMRLLLTTKTLSYLNPKTENTQFQRNRSFIDGLQQAGDAFNSSYRVTGGGMTKPLWEGDGIAPRKHDFPAPVDQSDFISAAKNLEGSQDTGNQLFCAMLRSAGVHARVVCSLQVLPFTSTPKTGTPKYPVKPRVLAIAADAGQSRRRDLSDDPAVRGSKAIGSVPSARRRLGQPSFATDSSRIAPKKKEKPVPKLSYPVFWVEAFNAAQQKWIAVDPVVTHSVNKSSQLEPPASYEYNQLTYAIALEDDGTARDVTKRYAKAYNAKTRRHRVESSVEGAKWFKKAMRIFRRPGVPLDRDQVEDAELAQKEAREGMPMNVLDFKDHPYYALERHLRRHEVLHPKREVGKVNAGTAAKPRMESVYRRSDVLICKSANKWYRVGREINEGEQPLKHISVRAKRQAVDGNDESELPTTTPLYAAYQTGLYIPPPVQRGRIPRNAYGNLDVYVPTMVPAGGVHIRHKFAQKAARLLRIDYADAVTGFKFQGRQGTAIIEGVVVAQQYSDAVHAAIEGFEEEVVEEDSRSRSLIALKLWKRFLTGLRIAERVSTYAEGATNEVAHVDEHADDTGGRQPGGFFTDEVQADALPTAGQFTIQELGWKNRQTQKTRRKTVDDSEGATEFPDEETESNAMGDGGSFQEQELAMLMPTSVPEDDGDGEGGFVQGEDVGGGFLQDEDAGGFVREEVAGGGFVVEPSGAGNILGEEGAEGGFIPEIEAHDTFRQTNTDTVTKVTSAPVQEVIDIPTPLDSTIPVEPPPSAAIGFPPHDSGEHIFPEDVTTITIDASTTDNNIPVSASADENTAPHSPIGDADVSGNETDPASIPSHDPEDDDAEPDWLESD